MTQRLEAFGVLPAEDVATLEALSARSRRVQGGQDVIKEGDKPYDVLLVIKGFACRYKRLTNGKRQIVALLLPGEFCDLHVFILEAMDHTIATLSDCDIVSIPPATILQMLERPALARALLLATLVDEATLREWIANLGQRPARDRLAHFFCEMHFRMKLINAVSDNTFVLPINQNQLAETVGLSLVHVNKSLKVLRQEGAVTFQGGRAVITDLVLLEKFSGFKSNYLHINAKTPRQFSLAEQTTY